MPALRKILIRFLYGLPLSTKKFIPGPRSVVLREVRDGQAVAVKYYIRDAIGEACLAGERLAHTVFANREWKVPVVSWHRRGLAIPWAEETLYTLAPRLAEAERMEAAQWCLDVLLDMYLAGYAYCDMHAANVLVIDGKYYCYDFETLTARRAVPFPESYDITGTDPPHLSPIPTTIGCWWDREDDAEALKNVLGVTSEDAMLEYLRRAEAKQCDPEVVAKVGALGVAKPA